MNVWTVIKQEKNMQHAATLALASFVLLTTLAACVTQPTKPTPEVQALISRAQSGDTEAQFKLGVAYDFGRGVGSNGIEAEKWYRKAAESGHAEAQNSLGSGYQTEKKYKEAYEWFEKAANQNHPLAINNLAYLHDLGLGVPQNRQKGYELYLRAAELGWAESMFNIGQMFGSGQLGEVDMFKGCVWTIRALKFSDSDREKEQVRKTVNYCKNKLSEDVYKKAEHEANAWTPKTHPKQ